MSSVRLFLYLFTVFNVCAQIGRAAGAEFNTAYNGSVSAGIEMAYTYVHNTSQYNAVRINFVSPDAEEDFPILLVVKQPRSVLSWTVPYVAQTGDVYSYISHTLCPDFRSQNRTSVLENITVTISTSSIQTVKFQLNASFVDDYNLETGEGLTIKSDPATPQYYQYQFPEGVQTVVAQAKSKDALCAYFSVQNAQCPIYDEFSTVRFNDGIFQTMTEQAAITVTRDMYPSGMFFVVVVVHASDEMCRSNYRSLIPVTARSNLGVSSRTKTVTITVKHTLDQSEYWKPIVTTFGVVLAIYVLIGIILAGYLIRQKYVDSNGSLEETGEERDLEGDLPFAQDDRANSNYGTADRNTTVLRRARDVPDDDRVDSEAALDEDDIDMLEDIESEKEVYRTKTELFVSDLARKKPGSLEKKYNLYAWNLFTVSVFYALPVVQLVITYQLVTNATGNQDTCYYNFMCAKPFGVFSAFNNVFSNTGYIFLGLLFLLLVGRRDYIHRKRAEAGDRTETTHGIPKHFGLLYALGYALIMEGVMSGCYHVCPNRTNYQFDTAYMYIIACLGMLKMYQQRHPDINANAYVSFALLALLLFIGFLGLVFSSLYFYIVFFIIHMLTCFGLSAQIYYMGTVKLDWGIFRRTFLICKTDIFTCAKPVHRTRLALLTVGAVVNFALSVFGLVTQPLDFASFLLGIMLVNMVLYLSFYFIMKLICREKILPVVILFTTLTLVLWAFALYFFTRNDTAWQYSPAVSREYNSQCRIMGFFDNHDIWHFLSAGALFVSFVGVLFLDDDLDTVPRTKIRVF